MTAPDEAPHGALTLRDVEEGDLADLFEHQRDPIAILMVPFTPRDRDAFRIHWGKLLGDPRTTKKAIVVDGAVVGNVLSFDRDGRREVGYWIDRAVWGRGVATRAVTAFLEHEPIRPLHAYVARHNIASMRVLEKCGFGRVGENENADGSVPAVEDVVLVLP